ncbi:hypothetical protein AWB91_09075 [Mycobacterium paraense]|uniref:Uncharacterized protein n=1 Tax=Mycobacterium paraense TaxID=767916 RepID=A0ABX3VUC3_9MYCO|nr:hypothetical protein AWB91_09075 [Mycobacterium paraense]ORW34671.1 hypothetical protein AWB88_02700 [Mycobacterium paraense]
MTLHRQVRAARALVDVGLAPLLEAVWQAGIETSYSCEGGADLDGYIAFPSVDDGVRFMTATAARTPHSRFKHLWLTFLQPWPDSGEFRARVAWPWPLTRALTTAWTEGNTSGLRRP